MSEIILRVGARGEIYTTREIRKKTGIKPGGRVRAIVVNGKLVIEAIPNVEDLIHSTLLTLTPQEAENISIEAQKEAELYG